MGDRRRKGNVTWGTRGVLPASVRCQRVRKIRAGAVPRSTVAPGAPVYGVRDRASDGERRRYLSQLRWGLVPSWAKDPKAGDRMINARAESLADKPAYQRAFQKHRGLVPADGFYEWQRRGGRKQPMFIHRRDGEPMAFAGLWAAWRDASEPDGEWLRSCAIVTTNANDAL